MDVTKAPPPDPASRPSVGLVTGAASGAAAPGAASLGNAASVELGVEAAADRVDIQPLDVAAALQILIAEVRAELPLPGGEAAPIPASGAVAALALFHSAVNPQDPGPVAAKSSFTMPVEEPAWPAALSPGTAGMEPAAPVAPGWAPTPAMPVSAATAPATTVPVPSMAFAPPTPGPKLAGGSRLPVGRETPTVGGPRLPIDEAPAVDEAQPVSGAPLPVLPSLLSLLSSPAQASSQLVRLFLQAVPEDVGNPSQWAVSVDHLEQTLQSALDRAVSAVEQWRNVPQAAVDAARETRNLVVSQLSDGPPNPAWLRPEWMWLTPRMERFRRRRRLARRGLSDPDTRPLRDESSPEQDGNDRQGERGGTT